MARTRAQSVFDSSEEDRLLMFCRFAKGNDVNFSRRLGVHDGNNNSVQQAERYEALLAVVESVVLKRVRDTFEDPWSIGEIEAVIRQIGLALGFAPRKAHIRIVYT